MKVWLKNCKVFNPLSIFSISIISLCFLGGCSTSIQVNSPTPVPEIPVDFTGIATAVISSVKISSNTRGASMRPESRERDLIKYRLRDTGIFHQVFAHEKDRAEKEIRLNFFIKRTLDYHDGVNGAKALMIAFTFFLLAPAMDLRLDYQESMTVEAIRWDGARKKYHAQSDGTSYSNIVNAPEKNLALEVQDHVFNSIISQMLEDRSFYLGMKLKIF